MRRDEAIRKLGATTEGLKGFFVRSLAVFGSVARDEAGADSDVDILVEYEPGARVGLFEFVRLQRFLSQVLEAPVDLATPEALRGEMKDQILQEAIRASWGMDTAHCGHP